MSNPEWVLVNPVAWAALQNLDRDPRRMKREMRKAHERSRKLEGRRLADALYELTGGK